MCIPCVDHPSISPAEEASDQTGGDHQVISGLRSPSRVTSSAERG